MPKITGLFDESAASLATGNVGLNHKLWVGLEPAPSATPDRYVLFFNGSEVKGLDPATDATYTISHGKTAPDTTGHALVFKLQRNSDNEVFWKDLMGSPKGTTVPVVVTLGQRLDSCNGSGSSGSDKCNETVRATIVGDPRLTTFNFKVYSTKRLVFAFIAIAIAFALVWGHARTSTTLRDNLLPQLPASSQPYSLGRWQMAFWFTLVFTSFVFLFFLLWDTNTVTEQALTLMGISGVTALAAVAIDVAKNTPADDANRGLQALGLNTYADVLRVEQEIAERQKELAALPQVPASADATVAASGAMRRAQLQVEINDRNVVLRTYRDKIGPFVSQGWFKDITTDLNGTAIHRLQVVCWTGALGIVFVIGVYHDLSMPAFSATLLALMGISSAGYVGFKYPEVNN